MKRLLVIMVMVVLFVATAHAESIDLESMSTDELLVLRNRINSILTERVASDTSAICSGSYTVGTDIKAGRYVLQLDELPEGETTGVVWLFANAEDQRNRKYITADYLTIGVEYQIVLEDGMVMEITRAKGTIHEIVKPDWAP